MFGFTVDLPGLSTAASLAALLVLVLPSARVVLGRTPDGRGPATTAVATALMWLRLTQTLGVGQMHLAVRFDLYRRWGPDLARLGHLEDALAAYRKADRHAPAGQSRRGAIELLERRLAR